MKVSIFVHDLASNPIVRVAPFAQAIRRLGYEVEILGFLRKGKKIYEPYRTLFDYRVLPYSGTILDTLYSASSLSKMATGDIIYAFKPLWTTYWPALLASRFGKSKPLLLDIEDDELWYSYQGLGKFFYDQVLHTWKGAATWKYNLLLHPLTGLAVSKTVSSRKLQKRYGGAIVLHGPDERLYDPSLPHLQPAACREQLHLPSDVNLAVFAGTPYKHKGLATLVEALAKPQLQHCHLVLAGPENYDDVGFAREVLGDRCHHLGFLPYALMPVLLAAVDVVPVPQLRNGYTEAQIPAKMIEAMAMGKAIIATSVSDMPLILGSQQSSPRGWVVPPANAMDLSEALIEIFEKPNVAQERGAHAREFFLRHASVDAIASHIKTLFETVC